LTLDRSAAAVFGQRFSWERATDQFVAAISGARAEAQLFASYELAPA